MKILGRLNRLTARHFCEISAKGAMLPSCNDAEMSTPKIGYTLRFNAASVMEDLM